MKVSQNRAKLGLPRIGAASATTTSRAPLCEMDPKVLLTALQAVPTRHKQVGALPFRRTSAGEIEVLLITSRRARRWIIPKGWPLPGLSFQESAAREALEEAGLIGRVAERSIGSFEYMKRLSGRTPCLCSVEVFPMHVEEVRAWWDEGSQRSRRWCNSSEVSDLVAHEPLQQLIVCFIDSDASMRCMR
jgi:8-oxo-dGTP pyrophosphatase MutT (NUDIX family)